MSSPLDAYLGLFLVALPLRLRGWSSDCGDGDEWAAGGCEGEGDDGSG